MRDLNTLFPDLFLLYPTISNTDRAILHNIIRRPNRYPIVASPSITSSSNANTIYKEPKRKITPRILLKSIFWKNKFTINSKTIMLANKLIMLILDAIAYVANTMANTSEGKYSLKIFFKSNLLILYIVEKVLYKIAHNLSIAVLKLRL